MPWSDFDMIRKTLPIILCVGKSSDRQHAEQIKKTLLDLVCVLREKNAESTEYNIEIVNYFFDDEVTSTSLLEPVENFDEGIFDDIFGTSSALTLSDLLFVLNDDLSRKKLFSNDIGYYAPIIVFILDGEKDYLYCGLECIKKNKWYRYSIKIAVVFNDYSENYKRILELIGKNPDWFIAIDKVDLLKELIEPISIDNGRMPESALENTSLVDNLIAFYDDNQDDSNVCTQVIAVPSKDKIHISGTYNLKKCQVSACEPDKANDDIVIIDTLHNGISVKNVSDMTLYTDRVVRSHDTRCFDYELGKNFSIDTRKDAFVSFDFNQDGKLITIENMSDDDIDFVVELNEEPHFMQTNDVIFDFNGDVLLMVVDDNNSSETNIEWFENDFDDGGWD